jgi:hypothetical protein
MNTRRTGTPQGARCVSSARWNRCGGARRNPRPYRDRWPVNDPQSGNRVRRHQARWRQGVALFIGDACYQKRQRTKLARACELESIATQ